jgi:DNA-binding transcriptional regulator YhcF (GntR family)
MSELDPDDPRPPYAQITNALRAAILTKTFQPGEQLPSQKELAERYHVSRATVQRALRDLQDDGLIIARQGSGAFVRSKTERPVGLRPHIERAFEEPRVTLDFAGFSSETLDGALHEPLDKIRMGRYTPESIAIRLLLPDPSQPHPIPVRISDGQPDERLTKRAQDILHRHVRNIVDTVKELEILGLVSEATTDVRVYGGAAFFKLYVINQAEAFFGFYPVRPNKAVVRSETVDFYDLLGRDSILFPFVSTEDRGPGREFVKQAGKWFDSVWDTIASEYEL